LLWFDRTEVQPVCIEILEIDVSKREDREARIDRPKYQWIAYRLVLHQKQDVSKNGGATALPNGRPNRMKALANREDRGALRR
jgi:hypothetical protein